MSKRRQVKSNSSQTQSSQAKSSPTKPNQVQPSHGTPESIRASVGHLPPVAALARPFNSCTYVMCPLRAYLAPLDLVGRLAVVEAHLSKQASQR